MNVIVHSDGAFNVGNYSNAKVDAMIDLSLVSMDPVVRLENLQEAMRIIIEEEVTGVPLFEYETLYSFVDDEISIGDYILTGGELPAMVIIDAAVRLIPGVLGDEDSARHDSFADFILDYPQYTRPPDYKGMNVPEVLLSGNHEEIRKWRRMQAIKNTYYKRPDLLEKMKLTDEDKKILNEVKKKA